jgi:hypothetical protein
MIQPLFELEQTVYVVTKTTVIKGVIKFIQTMVTSDNTELKYGVKPGDTDKVFSFEEKDIYLQFDNAKAVIIKLWEENKKKYDEIFEALTEESFDVKPETKAEG